MIKIELDNAKARSLYHAVQGSCVQISVFLSTDKSVQGDSHTSVADREYWTRYLADLEHFMENLDQQIRANSSETQIEGGRS